MAHNPATTASQARFSHLRSAAAQDRYKVMRITVMMASWPPVSSAVGHPWAMRPCGERVKSRRRLRH